MNLSMKRITKSLKLIPSTHFKRFTSKIAVDLNESLSQKIENEEVKPKNHPGIVKASRTLLPPNVLKALDRVVGDYPVKALMEDCMKLNHLIFSRHPPIEPKEIEAKIKSIANEIELIMPSEQKQNLTEDERTKWHERKDRLLQKRIKERTFAWKPIEYGQYESIVYAIARGALEYGVLMRILQEIHARDTKFEPRSYFDFGSGVGTGMWAASNLWKDSIFEYFNVDISRNMNELSELILRDGNDNKQMSLRNVYYRQFLPGLETKYDLVITSYSLFELSSAESRMSVILNLWKKCDGYLIIVEEGTRRGFELVNEARDYILSLEDHSLIGHVFAPCPHDNLCPRLTNPEDRTPCNFETSFVPTYLNKNSNKTVTARYSYVVLKKGLPDDNTRSWPRLVRPTLVRSKHCICRMCTSDGTLQEIIFAESKHGRPVFRCAKASHWGDRLPITIGETYTLKTKTDAIKNSKETQKNNEKEEEN